MSGIAGLDLATSSRAPPSAPLFETQYRDADEDEEELSLYGEEMSYYSILQLSTIAEESLSDLTGSVASLGGSLNSCPSLNSYSLDQSLQSPKTTPPPRIKDKISSHSSSTSAKQQQRPSQVGDNKKPRGKPITSIILELGDDNNQHKIVLSSPEQQDRKLSLETFLDFARLEEKKKRDPLEMKKESNHVSLYSTMTGEEVLLPEDDDEFTFVSVSSDGSGSGFQVSIASEGTGDFSELSISGRELLNEETTSQDPQGGKEANQETRYDVANTKLEEPSENSAKEELSATDPAGGELTKKNKNDPQFVNAHRKLSYEMSRKRLKESLERRAKLLAPVQEEIKSLDPLRRKMNYDLSRIKFNETFKRQVYPLYRKYLNDNINRKGLDTQEQRKSERFGGLQRKLSYKLSRKLFEDNVQKAQLLRLLVDKSKDLSLLTPEQERQHTLAATYDRSRRKIRYDASRCQLQSQLESRMQFPLCGEACII
jgi:hypothetical protein